MFLLNLLVNLFFPQIPEMRLIGRLAFPLFAYGIAAGAVYTKDGTKYLSRIVLLALISQPLYAIALAHENSAMYAVSFFENPFGAMSAFCLNSWQRPGILHPFAHSGQADVIEGVHLMLLFYALCEYPRLALVAWSAFLISWAKGYGYPFLGTSFSMRISALPAVMLCALPMKRRFTLPRWLTYSFYPAHLAVLMLVS